MEPPSVILDLVTSLIIVSYITLWLINNPNNSGRLCTLKDQQTKI